MAESQKTTVDTPCMAYNYMAVEWQLIDDLLGGSDAMRANSSTYLPQFNKEQEKHYNSRVNNSMLFSAYANTAKNVIAKPFSKPITINGNLPSPLDEIESDVDGDTICPCRSRLVPNCYGYARIRARADLHSAARYTNPHGHRYPFTFPLSFTFALTLAIPHCDTHANVDASACCRVSPSTAANARYGGQGNSSGHVRMGR